MSVIIDYVRLSIVHIGQIGYMKKPLFQIDKKDFSKERPKYGKAQGEKTDKKYFSLDLGKTTNFYQQ